MLYILLAALAINTLLSAILGLWSMKRGYGFTRIFFISMFSGVFTGVLVLLIEQRR